MDAHGRRAPPVRERPRFETLGALACRKFCLARPSSPPPPPPALADGGHVLPAEAARSWHKGHLTASGKIWKGGHLDSSLLLTLFPLFSEIFIECLLCTALYLCAYKNPGRSYSNIYTQGSSLLAEITGV